MWEFVERRLASSWFYDMMEGSFESHYACAECVNENRCEYWFEALDCYWEDGYNENEVIEEFQRNCEESSRAYALSQMNEWQKRTVFTHEHGKCIRWFWECSV